MSGVLYAVPYLRTLRQNFPTARILLLTNAYAASILEGCPYLDAIVPFYHFQEKSTRLSRIQSLAQQAFAWLRLVGRVDLVIHFRFVGGDTLLFCKLLGRPFQVGYLQGKNDHLLDLNVGIPDVELDSRTRNAKILAAMGIPPGSPEMEIWIPRAGSRWAGEWLASHGWQEGEPLVAFHPGCHWGCNEWLPERWSELGNQINARFGGKIVITGTERERPLAESIAQKMDTRPLIACGETDLIQFAALLDKADFVVAVDTAPTQICQALKKPAVVLMGAGNPAWNGPLPGEPMIMLQKWSPEEEEPQLCDFAAGICHNSYCRSRLSGIQVEEVLAALQRVFVT